jgi:hypothetical protein
MSDSHSTTICGILRLLRSYGIVGHEWPAMARKTCDIVARYRREHYYIEVKERFGPHRPGTYELKDGYTSSVHKVVEKAAKQLSAMPAVPGLCRVIWFAIPDDDEDNFLMRGIVHTLYGVARLKLAKGSISVETDCLFYRHSPFLKWTHLDLAIIDTTKGLIFCLNPASDNYRRIRKTRLFALMKGLNGVIDPKTLDGEKCCIIAVPGKTTKEIAVQTLAKYGWSSCSILTNEKHLSIGKESIIRIRD